MLSGGKWRLALWVLAARCNQMFLEMTSCPVRWSRAPCEIKTSLPVTANAVLITRPGWAELETLSFIDATVYRLSVWSTNGRWGVLETCVENSYYAVYWNLTFNFKGLQKPMRICKLHANVQSYIINSWGFPVILLWSCNHSALIWDQQGRKTQGPHWYAADVDFSIISDHKEQSEGRLRLDENSFARLQAQTPALNAMTSFTSAAHWDCFQVLLYIVIEQARNTFEKKMILAVTQAQKNTTETIGYDKIQNELTWQPVLSVCNSVSK